MSYLVFLLGNSGDDVKKLAITLMTFALVASACGGGETVSEPASTAASSSTSEAATVTTDTGTTTTPAPTATTTTTPTTTTAATTTTAEATTTTAEPAPVLTADGDTWTIAWASTTGPFWSPADASSDDPFYFIHTFAENDGFYFALEMYTTGYGALWTGELGEVEIGCMEGLPGANSTGICPHFDPDGDGPIEASSAFVATGSITINQLDADGYDIVVNEIVYPDGTTIAGFQLVGP